ncbi:hypothetical protein DL764_007587 [Monosporascus ibericus]|uniref:Uncharacterized protein n=1 Tax=Monosporascus ibericus TaxID=155417 RepID=A0A4Q4T2K0_9PEZI|nr:hypothetical protein DL764_007587 [Monosporascus ibericus]
MPQYHTAAGTFSHVDEKSAYPRIPQVTFGTAVAIGLGAGLAGAAGMALVSKVEQVFTHRPNSYVPGRTVATHLGLSGDSFARHPDILNHIHHFGMGFLAGPVRAIMSYYGIIGPVASFMHTGIRIMMDQVVENAAGVSALPWTWPINEQVIDVSLKGVYALTTGYICDRSRNMQSVLHPVVGPKKEIHDLNGRVALVVGGALGIGYEISRAFVQNGARVIMVNRKEDQGEDAIKKIKEEVGQDAKVEWVGCDMGNLKQIKEVFTGIREREDRLDLLILSAGINANQYGETTDGIDRHFQVNWLGQFYVCNLLFPLIRKTSKIPDAPAPRIVWESSTQHQAAPSVVHFGSVDEINDSKVGNLELYGRAKLAIILGVKFGFVDRVIKPNGDNIYALSVHPGAVNTAMQQQWKDAYPGLFGKIVTNMMLVAGRDIEQGSYSALYAATAPEVEEKGWNGAYFDDPGKLGSQSRQAQDPALGAALWDLSHRLIKEKVGEDAMVDWTAAKS